MSSPSISVVMSVYNDAAYLAESIDSVLSQTKPDFEFIIVNDGSTDSRIGEILAEYARRDRRIQIITKQNEGLTKALIDGCAASRGEYIARIDVGDVMTAVRLEKQKAVFDECTDISFASAHTEFCGPEWEPLYIHVGRSTPEGGMRVLPQSVDADLLAGPTHHGSVMFRRYAYNSCGGYRAAFYYGQDWDLWYRLAEQGLFTIVPAVLYRARFLLGGLSAAHRKRQKKLGRLSRECMRLRRMGCSDANCLEQARSIRRQGSPWFPRNVDGAVFYLVGEALRRRGDPRAVIYLKRSCRARPGHVVSWIRWAQANLLRRR